MPAEDRQNITMTPEQRAHGERIASRRVKGFAFRRGDGSVNWSAVARYAMAEALKRPAKVKRPPAVEQTATVSPARDTTPDVGRLLAALTRAGLRPGQADRAAGVAKGTARNTLGGLVALDKAGGGELLAWVESVEGGFHG